MVLTVCENGMWNLIGVVSRSGVSRVAVRSFAAGPAPAANAPQIPPVDLSHGGLKVRNGECVMN